MRGAATLVPTNQEVALAALARLVRDRSDAQVVAVVGSTGKTTTKDALGALCAAVTPTIAAEASRNNELGLPLTVLRLEPETRVLVTEMGMRGLGQVAELCAIARPTVALVTSIGPEHLELVGTVEDVARGQRRGARGLAVWRDRRRAVGRAAARAVPASRPRCPPLRSDRRGRGERWMAVRRRRAGAGASAAVHAAPPCRERACRAHGLRRAGASSRARP